MDPNTKDKHTYSIVSGGSGKFELRGADLFTLTTFNYETAPNRWVWTQWSLCPYSLFSFTLCGYSFLGWELCYAADFARIKEHSGSAWPLCLCSLLHFTPCRHSCLDWQILLVLRCRFSLVIRSTVWTLCHCAFVHCSIEPSFTLDGYSPLDWKSLFVLRCRFSLIIRSSDNGSPPMRLDKTFTISVTDVNEKPTAIQVSRVWLVIYNRNDL